jgi:hypothetical protein
MTRRFGDISVPSNFFVGTPRNPIFVVQPQGVYRVDSARISYTSNSDEYVVFDATEGHFIDVLGKAESA